MNSHVRVVEMSCDNELERSWIMFSSHCASGATTQTGTPPCFTLWSTTECRATGPPRGTKRLFESEIMQGNIFISLFYDSLGYKKQQDFFCCQRLKCINDTKTACLSKQMLKIDLFPQNVSVWCHFKSTLSHLLLTSTLSILSVRRSWSSSIHRVISRFLCWKMT